MSKQKTKSKSSKILTPYQILDFLYLYKSGMEAGASHFQIFNILKSLSDNLSFQKDLQLTANKLSLGLSPVEVFIQLANSRDELVIKRFLRGLIMANTVGLPIIDYIMGLIRGVEISNKVELSKFKIKEDFLPQTDNDSAFGYQE